MRNKVVATVLFGITLNVLGAFAEDAESFIIEPEDVTKANAALAKDGSAYLEVEFTKGKSI